ncbi:hypothetical protein HYP06_gp064 [Vibrio phage vB_VspP_pVa5]|uniref:Uncharacterized protein n=1 Tax=Vibrio phage vB_VspP_pVa5 TaxID=1913109 RepID=A0A1J0GVB5_9CAUD|nr:hypothetical protein HYP06_gp064 [Vibrio phage vB_VspP_pVa5]APC46117.1 hypothetical protein vBVspPpVa5_0064 [Vibrio phage vB_VspP_pVa5]
MGVTVLHLPTKAVLSPKGYQVGTQINERTSEFLLIDPSMALYRSKSKAKALRMANMYSVVS